MIRILKRENQLHLFRRLEQCSQKQVNCETAIEFLKLCQNFELTPTFAKVEKTKAAKWKRSTKTFEENVVTEELRQKAKRMTELREEINGIYDEIREKCSLLRFACILKTIVALRNEQYTELMKGHTKKISKLLYYNTDVDEHITNLSSYRLSFFEKLALCRGLDFALPQRVSPMVIQATFEKAYWKLEPRLSEENKELAAATLRSIALNYVKQKGPTPPKTMLRAIGQLKKKEDIVITRPDKGSGVVVMDKSDYVRLLKEASIDDETKFRPVQQERPKTRGRPPKHYHPLLQKEKELTSIVRRILPKHIADSVIQKGSRLAHLYGLPKTHKAKLAVRPILSATGTYNYNLAKWLDTKLKPLSTNTYTVKDIFSFADEIHKMEINNQEVLVSYDVSSLFTNVPVSETIELLAEKAFKDDWFNKEYDLNITKPDLIELLEIATKNQLFQFQESLYEQVDGVAMGSPLGPLMANTFMCGIEEQLETQNKMPAFYRRYVDDTLSKMPDTAAASEFLSTLNESHPSISFTMELEDNNKLPFLGMEIIKNGSQLDTKVYKKPTDTGLLLHYQSHVDLKYKHSLLQTMLNRAFKLSSNWQLFHQECERLKETFARLHYPESLVQSAIRQFVEAKVVTEDACPRQQDPGQQEVPIRVVLPYKDQKSANSVRRQLSDLSRKINSEIQPVYTSRKISDEIKVREQKPPLVNQQCVVYQYKCDLCDTDYVGYSCRHLHQRIEEHKKSAIGQHVKEEHGKEPQDIGKNFKILKKCQSKLDCLIFEMLFIKRLKPKLNKQCDSIRAKLFT